MVIMLELPPEVEAQMREDAANGDAEAVRRTLTEALAPVVDATVEDSLQDHSMSSQYPADGLTDEEFEALLDELVNMSPVVPSLPDSAISREGIYGEHP